MPSFLSSASVFSTFASFSAASRIFFASSFACRSSVFAMVVSCVRWLTASVMSSLACCFSVTASRYSCGSWTLLSWSEMARAYTPPSPSSSGPSSFSRSFSSMAPWMAPREEEKDCTSYNEHVCCTALRPAATTTSCHLLYEAYFITTGLTHSCGSWNWNVAENSTRSPSLETHVWLSISKDRYVLGNLMNLKPGGPACKPPSIASSASFFVCQSYARPNSASRARWRRRGTRG